MRTTCSRDEDSAMRFVRLPFKCYPAVGSAFESSQTWQGGFLTFAEVGEDFVEHQIQAIGSLGLAHSRPPGQLPCDVRLLHFAPHDTKRFPGEPAGEAGDIPQTIGKATVERLKKHENSCEWEKLGYLLH